MMSLIIIVSIAFFSFIMSIVSIPRIIKDTDGFVGEYDMLDESAFKSLMRQAVRPFIVRAVFNAFAFIACVFVIYYLLMHNKKSQFQMVLVGLFAFMSLNHFINIIYYARLANFGLMNARVPMAFNIISMACTIVVFIIEGNKYLA